MTQIKWWRSREVWLKSKFSFEARRTRRARILKDDNHAVNLTDIDIMNKVIYIHDNPVRPGLVDEAVHYVYSSARGYAGEKEIA